MCGRSPKLPSTCYPSPLAGSLIKSGQLGYEPVPIQDASVAGGSLSHYTTTLALNVIFLKYAKQESECGQMILTEQGLGG